MMKIVDKVKELQDYSINFHATGKKVAIVPTMGFLHEGHLSLVDKARGLADIVIVSIFVNPTQFGAGEDLDKYPQDFEGDCDKCRDRGVDIVFAPSVSEMYPDGASTWVVEENLTKSLCGRSRPEHFKGVTTVCTKLFNISLADFAVFGQKDAQQLLVLKRIVRDLNIPVKIETGHLVRESDGLALSSRNKYLDDDQREKALSISRSLFEAKEKTLKGDIELFRTKSFIVNEIEKMGGIIDYIEIVDSESLKELNTIKLPLMIAVAVKFGKIRLIDNILIDG